METYAIVPYFPGSIVDSTTLRRIGDLAEKYNIKTIINPTIAIIAIIRNIIQIGNPEF